MTRHIKVIIEDRPDGGYRVWSNDLPGFVLSGRNRTAVLADIEPAAKGILQHNGQSTDIQIDAVFIRPPGEKERK